jgi:hypothetical protein
MNLGSDSADFHFLSEYSFMKSERIGGSRPSVRDRRSRADRGPGPQPDPRFDRHEFGAAMRGGPVGPRGRAAVQVRTVGHASVCSDKVGVLISPERRFSRSR